MKHILTDEDLMFDVLPSLLCPRAAPTYVEDDVQVSRWVGMDSSAPHADYLEILRANEATRPIVAERIGAIENILTSQQRAVHNPPTPPAVKIWTRDGRFHHDKAKGRFSLLKIVVKTSSTVLACYPSTVNTCTFVNGLLCWNGSQIKGYTCNAL